MSTAQPTSDLLKGSDVARIFQVNTSTVSRWGQNGTLKPVRVNGTVRYRREDVERLLRDEQAS